jgi:hypothetical protein
MSFDEYVRRLVRARLTLTAMLTIFPGGLAALLRYERLLFTRPDVCE